MNLINEQKISKIVMYPTAQCLCVLGKDWYTLNYTITIYPEKLYPDYTDVVRWIADNINGKALNIEDAINEVWKYLAESLECRVEVQADVEYSLTHCPVTVIK